MIETSMHALIYCLSLIIKDVMQALASPEKKYDYEEMKYLLSALEDATQGLGSVSYSIFIYYDYRTWK
jgi:hypothetical protein